MWSAYVNKCSQWIALFVDYSFLSCLATCLCKKSAQSIALFVGTQYCATLLLAYVKKIIGLSVLMNGRNWIHCRWQGGGRLGLGGSFVKTTVQLPLIRVVVGAMLISIQKVSPIHHTNPVSILSQEFLHNQPLIKVNPCRPRHLQRWRGIVDDMQPLWQEMLHVWNNWACRWVHRFAHFTRFRHRGKAPIAGHREAATKWYWKISYKNPQGQTREL